MSKSAGRDPNLASKDPTEMTLVIKAVGNGDIRQWPGSERKRFCCRSHSQVIHEVTQSLLRPSGEELPEVHRMHADGMCHLGQRQVGTIVFSNEITSRA